jgi:hypothetical protein
MKDPEVIHAEACEAIGHSVDKLIDRVDILTPAIKQLRRDRDVLRDHLDEITAALLAAIEVIHVWHDMSGGSWKDYYDTDPDMRPIREVLERADAVGSYEATDD